MGRFIKSTRELLGREHRLFSSLDYGPITARCTDDGVTATTADGLTVELSTNVILDRSPDRELFRKGVEVHTNGELVGHLTQLEHGFWRSRRVLNLVGVEPDRFPAGSRFRLRGFGLVSLEADSGRLIGYFPVLPRIRVRPGVTEEMAAIFAAVKVGLYPVLQQAIVWKK